MRRVLFVDDDPVLLAELARQLSGARGWKTSFASSGPQAMDWLGREPFDVVVADMGMPVMDGAALLSQVLERYPSVIRIVLSGHTDIESAMRAIPVAQQFLTKPCDPEQLRDVVERACALREKLAEDRIRAAVGRVKQLPTRPMVYCQLERVLSDPNASIAQVARVIEQDPGISTKVLQLVNSAFIGIRYPTASIETAAKYIGFKLLRSLVAYCGIYEVAARAGGAAWKVFDQHHALVTAGIARAIADEEQEYDDAFTSGLLHDVGRLVLGLSFGPECSQLTAMGARREQPEHVLERELFGVTSGEVGGYLLGLWGLPLLVVEAVSWHAEPWCMGDPRWELPAVLHVACLLSREEAPKAGAPLHCHTEEERDYLQKLDLDGRLTEWRQLAAALRTERIGFRA